VSELIKKEHVDASRGKIAEVVSYLAELPQIECPVVHRFAPGCYLREITMPKDSVVVGKIHATEHFNIIISGSATVITINDSGDFERVLVSAGDTFVSGAGVQKAVVNHADCTWQTVHVTDKTDIAEIEKDVIAESYDQLAISSLIAEAGRIE